MPPFTYRLTLAAAVPSSLREQVAEAFVAAARRFALEAGIDRLTIDNPMARGFFSFRSHPAPRAPELAGLFPTDRPGPSGPLPPSGYHDGARVPLDTGLELLRAVLLREGPWCRLHAEGGFFLHVGERHDLYTGGATPYADAAAHARRAGLTVEAVERSPYDPALDESDPCRPRTRPSGRRSTAWSPSTAGYWSRSGTSAATTGGTGRPRPPRSPGYGRC